VACSKTTILFVIRDYDFDTPIEAIQAKIQGQMADLWRDLRKPDGLADVPMSDMFEFAFAPLPHFKHEAQKFAESITDLREWFARIHACCFCCFGLLLMLIGRDALILDLVPRVIFV
jgi:hypothetical protein